MTKANRKLIFDKYGGRCAYCGCELLKGWHVDEIEPCRRKYKTIPAHYVNENGKVMDDSCLDEFTEKLGNGLLIHVPTKYHVFDGHGHPEKLNIENQNPACASCNINKHSDTLENFRNLIAGFKKHLNEINTQYKISKRYGLVIEVDKPVIFYFETIKQTP